MSMRYTGLGLFILHSHTTLVFRDRQTYWALHYTIRRQVSIVETKSLDIGERCMHHIAFSGQVTIQCIVLWLFCKPSDLRVVFFLSQCVTGLQVKYLACRVKFGSSDINPVYLSKPFGSGFTTMETKPHHSIFAFFLCNSEHLKSYRRWVLLKLDLNVGRRRSVNKASPLKNGQILHTSNSHSV